MTRDEAARLLGVAPGAGSDEIRHAFRRQLFRHHPDVAGGSGTAPTHQLIAAYRLLHGPPQSPESSSVSSRERRAREPLHGTDDTVLRGAGEFASTGVVLAVHGETIHLGLPPAQTFALLLEAGDGLGEVAYIDRSVGIIETIVVFEDFPVCSVVCSLQPPRSRTAVTDVWVTVESLTGAPPPPAEGVAALVGDRLRELLRRGS